MSENNWGPSASGMPQENRQDLASFHEPVLRTELLDFLQPAPNQLYLDGTVGGGGHARQILEACEDCLLLAVDRDPEALSVAKTALYDLGCVFSMGDSRWPRKTLTYAIEVLTVPF